MQEMIATVGPLASSSATKIALSQSPPTAGNIVLNGAAGSFTANNIAKSQTVSGATAVALNGTTSTTLVQNGKTGAYLGSMQYIYITSAGNDSGITFAILGLDQYGTSISETITGSNTSVVSSNKQYWSIISITTSGSTASTITVGSYGSATLDTPRQVLITTSSTTGFIITGTDWAGNPISETVTNAGSSVASVLSYATVISIYSSSAPATTVEAGTNGVADSNWVEFDNWSFGPTAIQANASGTVNYTLFFTMDNPNVLFGTAPNQAGLVWSSSGSTIVGATSTSQSSLTVPYKFCKVTLNSGTGSVVTKFIQYSAVTT